MTVPLDELSQNDLVVLEIPPVTLTNFENDLLTLVNNLRQLGPRVLMVVHPSLRKRMQHYLWVHRWAQLNNTPFRLEQTCSCKLGNYAPNCHVPLYVGTDLPIDFSPLQGSTKRRTYGNG